MSFLKTFYRLLDIPWVYDFGQKIAGSTNAKYRDLITNYVRKNRDGRILDLGCGIGNFRNNLSDDYYGIDINRNYIKHARSMHTGSFEVMDGTDLSFADNYFNHVISIATLHHMNDHQIREMLKEALRVCKDDGSVHLMDAVRSAGAGWLPGFKRLWFSLDRGNHQRSLDELLLIVQDFDGMEDYRIERGILHDIVYLRFSKIFTG